MIRLHPDANWELREAWLWYHEISEREATAFQSAVDEAFAAILEGPLRWPKGKHETRHYVIRVFRYVVVYRVAAQDILVFAISHGNRKPEYWKRRIKDSF